MNIFIPDFGDERVRGFLRALLCVIAAPVLLLAASVALSAPPAGAQIVNQASVSFVDDSNTTQTAVTNEVVMTVTQVFAATIEQDRVLSAVPDQLVVFNHILENVGNGPDQYQFTVTQDSTRGPDSGQFDSISAYRDSNNNGVVDGGDTLLATGIGQSNSVTLAAGERAALLIEGHVPATAVATNIYDLTFTVEGYNDTGSPVVGSVVDTGSGKGNDLLDGTNEDRAIVTNDAVLVVAKSAVYDDNGTASTDDDLIEYFVTVTNVGNTRATDVIVTDVIDVNTSYDPTFGGGVGVTSTNVAAWDEPSLGADDGYNGTIGSLPAFTSTPVDQIVGEADEIGPRRSVDFSYRVTVDPGLAAGQQLLNTVVADGELNDAPGTNEAAVTSNQTVDVVPVVYDVVITDIGGTASPGVNDGADDDGVVNDIQNVDIAARGESVQFTNIVTNTGNSDDSFNLTVPVSTFPAGTLFKFFQADGFTPLLDDINKDGIVDSGILSVGQSRTIVVTAILPGGVGAPGVVTATVLATSNLDPSPTPANDPVTEQLDAINAPVTDLANSAAATGFNDSGAVNADPVTATPVTSVASGPGGAASFPLFVANEGSNTDNYVITAWSDAAATQPLPSGWTVQYRDSGNTLISNTPILAPGAAFAFTADVYVPANQFAGASQNVYFRVESLQTGVSDIKFDEVIVTGAEAISLKPNNTGVVAPCSSVNHFHDLINIGQTQEDVAISVASQSLLASNVFVATAWSGPEPANYQSLGSLSAGNAVAIYDDSASAYVTVPLASDGGTGVAIPLDPRDEARLRVQVFAPCGTPEGSIDTLVLQAAVVDGVATDDATDVTTVSSYNLQLNKSGAADPACNQTTGTFSTAGVGATPGECVIWQIRAFNSGVETVCNVQINDGAPVYTTINVGNGLPVVASEPAPGTGACVVNGSSIACNVGNDIDITGDLTPENFCLRPAEEAVVRFRVQVD